LDECGNEADDLRREKERLREEKNDLLIKCNKQIQNEKHEKRMYKSENDRLVLKIRQMDMELASFSNKTEDNESGFSRLTKVYY